MADETQTTENGQPSGAGAQLEGMMKEFGFEKPEDFKKAFLGYKTDIADLKQKAENGTATAQELANLKQQMEEEKGKKMTESEKQAKALAELEKKYNESEKQRIQERRINLINSQLLQVTQNATAEEKELFTEFVTLKLAGEEFSTAEELKPKFDSILEKWSKLGAGQSPAQMVPEGRQGQGHPTGGAKGPQPQTFSERMQSWLGRKG